MDSLQVFGREPAKTTVKEMGEGAGANRPAHDAVTRGISKSFFIGCVFYSTCTGNQDDFRRVIVAHHVFVSFSVCVCEVSGDTGTFL